MDIWVERTVENYQKLKRAFKPAEWRLTLIVHKVATFIPGSSTNAITRLLALKYCPVIEVLSGGYQYLKIALL